MEKKRDKLWLKEKECNDGGSDEAKTKAECWSRDGKREKANEKLWQKSRFQLFRIHVRINLRITSQRRAEKKESSSSPFSCVRSSPSTESITFSFHSFRWMVFGKITPSSRWGLPQHEGTLALPVNEIVWCRESSEWVVRWDEDEEKAISSICVISLLLSVHRTFKKLFGFWNFIGTRFTLSTSRTSILRSKWSEYRSAKLTDCTIISDAEHRDNVITIKMFSVSGCPKEARKWGRNLSHVTL